MTTTLFGYTVPWPPYWVIPVFAGAVLLLALIIFFILKAIAKWLIRKTPDHYDEVIGKVRNYLLLILFMAAAYVVAQSLTTGLGADPIIDRVSYAAFISVAVIALAHIAISVLVLFLQHKPALKPIAKPINTFAKLLAGVIGVVIILDNLGVSLTAVWTTLGVGSLAIALALQDTLANLFSGLYMRADQPLREEDYIRLESGLEGFVENIGWRSTRIRQYDDNMVIIPNKTLAESVIVNMNMPKGRCRAEVEVGVAYNSDLDRVDEVLMEIAKSASDIAGFDKSKEPQVRLIPGFGASSIDFKVRVYVMKYDQRWVMESELRKRIHKRFREEGIEIPFPQRDIWLRDEEVKRGLEGRGK